jgi:hypothetical protein
VYCVHGTYPVLRIRDLVFFLPPRSGMNFFPDPESFWLWLRLRLCSCNYKKQEKSKFAFYFSLKIQDEKMFGSVMRKYMDPQYCTSTGTYLPVLFNVGQILSVILWKIQVPVLILIVINKFFHVFYQASDLYYFLTGTLYMEHKTFYYFIFCLLTDSLSTFQEHAQWFVWA